MSTAGRALSSAEINELWEAWTPSEVAQRMSTVSAPWYVAAGWALELFTGDAAREHDDLEIAVPAARFGEVVAAFPGFEWDVVGDGQIWPYPDRSRIHHQTWLRDPATGRYRMDVFREPHVGDLWVCRRDASITLPYSELILHTNDGIPYTTPEVALLFKAKQVRSKDEADFQRVLPNMTQTQRSRLTSWISSPPRPPMDHATRKPRALTALTMGNPPRISSRAIGPPAGERHYSPHRRSAPRKPSNPCGTGRFIR